MILLGLASPQMVSCHGLTLDQIPPISVKIFKPCYNAAVLVARFLEENDALAQVLEMISGEVVCFEEKEDSTFALISNCLSLSVVSSTRQQKT